MTTSTAIGATSFGQAWHFQAHCGARLGVGVRVTVEPPPAHAPVTRSPSQGFRSHALEPSPSPSPPPVEPEPSPSPPPVEPSPSPSPPPPSPSPSPTPVEPEPEPSPSPSPSPPPSTPPPVVEEPPTPEEESASLLRSMYDLMRRLTPPAPEPTGNRARRLLRAHARERRL